MHQMVLVCIDYVQGCIKKPMHQGSQVLTVKLNALSCNMNAKSIKGTSDL